MGSAGSSSNWIGKVVRTGSGSNLAHPLHVLVAPSVTGKGKSTRHTLASMSSAVKVLSHYQPPEKAQPLHEAFCFEPKGC
jgi:hypothetical protein